MLTRGLGVVLYCHLPAGLANLNLYRLVLLGALSTEEDCTRGLYPLREYPFPSLLTTALLLGRKPLLRCEDCGWNLRPPEGVADGESLNTDTVASSGVLDTRPNLLLLNLNERDDVRIQMVRESGT
jgi:hypothetical protein